MTGRLEGKRVLITQADEYMGPAIIEMFDQHGAEVIADRTDLTDLDAAARVVAEGGRIDVLIANLAADARFGVSAVETDQDTWHSMFDIMVHPLHRLTQAVLPQMIERRKGKIIVVGSATGVRGMAGTVAYSAARHAQVGYIRSTALEVAEFNVQINLIAQHWVENPAYFPPEFVATPEFQEVFKSVPMPRLARPEEDALFALFLASDESDFFVGQAIPFTDDIRWLHEPVLCVSEECLHLLVVRIASGHLQRMDHVPCGVGVVMDDRSACHADFPGPATDFFRRLHDTIRLVVFSAHSPFIAELDVDDRPGVLFSLPEYRLSPALVLLI